MIYLQLFFSFFKIGIFSFGGGYASLPLIQKELVDARSILTYNEFIDLLTISEITPGPIAVNAATFAGNRVAGLPGGIVSTLGVVTPAIIIVLLLGYLYSKYSEMDMVQGVIHGLRPASVALIASAAVTLVMTALFGTTSWPTSFNQVNFIGIILFLIALYLLQKHKVSSIKIIALSGSVGGLIYALLDIL